MAAFVEVTLIATLVAAVLAVASLLAATRHDELASAVSSLSSAVRELRGERYVLGVAMTGGVPGGEAASLRRELERYRALRDEEAEAAWEAGFLPRMHAFAPSAGAEAAEAFAANEASLASARASLADAERGLAAMESNPAAMWLVRAFHAMSRGLGRARDAAARGREEMDRARDAVEGLKEPRNGGDGTERRGGR